MKIYFYTLIITSLFAGFVQAKMVCRVNGSENIESYPTPGSSHQGEEAYYRENNIDFIFNYTPNEKMMLFTIQDSNRGDDLTIPVVLNSMAIESMKNAKLNLKIAGRIWKMECNTGTEFSLPPPPNLEFSK